jgi:hypothetical protein
MTRAIEALLEQATEEFAQDGLIFSDTQMQLAAEGYDLDQLEHDVAMRILASHLDA